jgi:hypothetical protein
MVAARLQEQHGMFRLFGCLVVQLFGCSAVQLLGRSAESVGRPRDGSTSPEMPVAFRRFCPESGADSLSGPAFRACFGICFSGRRIRLCNFCRSSFRRRACNSLLPVFLDLCRVPMI